MMMTCPGQAKFERYLSQGQAGIQPFYGALKTTKSYLQEPKK